MIQITNLIKSFGRINAVDDISLNVAQGEIVSILGMNGAGKTTTIRILVGILKPTSGSVIINNYDVLKQPRNAKAITGYIPDRAQLYGKLTGLEFLQFSCKLYNIKNKEAELRIGKLLEEYGLNEWKDELIENYSHGLRQRLATCSALAHSPQVLIIDEPMVGLDPIGAKVFRENLKRYAKEGMTVLLSTHSLPVAEDVSDRLAIIKKGKIVALGTLDELKSKAGNGAKDLEETFLQIAMTSEAP